MKVILESDVMGLGEEGTIVDVSPGYARNYLLPKNKAVQYNLQNMAILKSKMKSIEHRREENRKAHMDIKERLESEEVTILVKTGEKGHLYGSVTTQVVADELEKKGISVSKSSIVLPDGHSIKEIGTYSISIKLYHGVQAQCTIHVADKNAEQKEENIKSIEENAEQKEENIKSIEENVEPIEENIKPIEENVELTEEVATSVTPEKVETDN